MASSQSFSMIHLRMSLSPEPAPPVNSGEPLEDDGKPGAVLLLGGSYGFELGDHVLQEQQRAVVDARQAGAEAAVEATLSCSRWISFCCFFQSTPNGGLVRR